MKKLRKLRVLGILLVVIAIITILFSAEIISVINVPVTDEGLYYLALWLLGIADGLFGVLFIIAG